MKAFFPDSKGPNKDLKVPDMNSMVLNENMRD